MRADGCVSWHGATVCCRAVPRRAPEPGHPLTGLSTSPTAAQTTTEGLPRPGALKGSWAGALCCSPGATSHPWPLPAPGLVPHPPALESYQKPFPPASLLQRQKKPPLCCTAQPGVCWCACKGQQRSMLPVTAPQVHIPNKLLQVLNETSRSPWLRRAGLPGSVCSVSGGNPPGWLLGVGRRGEG